jgi:DNA repair protein RecO
VAHHIYQTEGFVLGSTPVGEANRYLQLFTRDLGLIGASAQGVRLLKSKLRYSLQDFSHSNISLVAGKHVWRVTNAAGISSPYFLFREDRPKLVSFARIISLLSRMLPGHERNEALYEIVCNAYAFLRAYSLSASDLKNFEMLAVLRILHNLGYVGDTPVLAPFCQGIEFVPDLLQRVDLAASQVLREINRALKESQL